MKVSDEKTIQNLDTDELIFHLNSIKINELVEGKKEMEENQPLLQCTIKQHLSDFKDFF